MNPLLRVANLTVSFPLGGGRRAVAVDGVSVDVHARKTVALVGESGSGKSVTALAAMGLLPKPSARIDSGEIVLRTRDEHEINLLALRDKQLQQIRGREMGMIFQEPMTSLNPVLSIREQLEESVLLHSAGLSKAQRMQRIEGVLHEVGMQHAIARLDQYPHQFSGGMRQRIMIAMALICEPRVLLADEPTTALDVTVQAQVLELMRGLQAQRGLGIVLITHDLGVVRKYADEVCVMYAGRVVERASVAELFANPVHPYTRALLACIPKLDKGGTIAAERPRLQTVRALLEGSEADPRWTLHSGARVWWPWHKVASGVQWQAMTATHAVLVVV